MSTAPAKPCRHPRCAGFAAAGSRWCPAHQVAAREQVEEEQAAQDEQRGTAASRGYGSRWRTASLSFRAKYPVCGGYLVQTVEHTPSLAMIYSALRSAAQQVGHVVQFFHERMAWLSRFPIYTVRYSKPIAPFARPTCGRPTSVVDHIIPHRGDQDLFWSEWNWQALCKHCHDHKTASTDGGFRGAQRPLVSNPIAPGLV